jgi:hypothetical protein
MNMHNYFLIVHDEDGWGIGVGLGSDLIASHVWIIPPVSDAPPEEPPARGYAATACISEIAR